MTEADTPLFSVVTCCYNQGRYLHDNIQSVLDQGIKPFEHIVVDDGSTDDTAEICRGYPHVRYIHQDNAGQSAALNRGFREARGEIIAWVNSDDYYQPGAFSAVAPLLEVMRNKTLVAGAANVVNEQGAYLWQLPNGTVPFRRLLLHPRLYRCQGYTVMPCQPSVFFHRSLLDDIGDLDTSLKYGMDYEFWLRALTRGYRFHYLPRVLSLYRYHATSHTMQGYDTFLPEWDAVSERYRKACPAAEQKALERTWRWMALESFFVRRHKQAAQHVAERVGHDPGAHPWLARVLVAARAGVIAPWYPPVAVYRMIAGPAPVLS